MVLQRITHAGAAPPTNLVSAITATAMSFALASSTGWPTGTGGPFVIDIDAGQPTEEKILCSSLSGGTVTVLSRGWDNTVATAHAPGTALNPNVTLVFSAAEADDANSHIYDHTRNDHSQYATSTSRYVKLASTIRISAATATTIITALATAGHFYLASWQATLSSSAGDGVNTVGVWTSDNVTNSSGATSLQTGGWDTVGGAYIWACPASYPKLDLIVYGFAYGVSVVTANPNSATGATSITLLDLGTTPPS